MKLSNDNPAKRNINTVKVGEKGQIVIPKEMRNMFDIKAGDSLVILADSNQGISLVSQEFFERFSDEIFNKQLKNKEDIT